MHTINRAAVLRYLRHADETPDELVAEQLAEAADIVLRLARPRAVYRLFDLERTDGSTRLRGTAFTCEGRDICAHLRAADQCILMAATLGAAVEQEMRRVQVTDMPLTTILDATASTAIEQICDTLQEDLAAWAAERGRFVTARFSPGYGDMPLAQQRILCAVLDTAKIGLSVTEHFLLTPRKSVTAMLGLCPAPVAERPSACAVCKMGNTCAQRKAGVPCEKPFIQ